MTKLHNVLDPLTDGRTRTQGAAGTQFATKARPTHWGTDLRANVYDTPGDDVRAPCDMTLVMAGVGNGLGLSPIPWHSGRFQYWDMGVWGGDRMYLYLGHLYAHVGGTTPGRTVTAGTHVAEMGGSGAGGGDSFVDHLHIGVAQNTPRPTGLLRSGQGWIDPVKWFDKHGVNFNTTPTATTISLASTTPTGGLTVTDVEDLKKLINEKFDALDERLKTHDGNSWDQRRATETQINAVDARLKAHDGNSWSQFRQTQAAVFGPLEVLANTPGVTVEELRQAIAETAVTVDVNVNQKEG